MPPQVDHQVVLSQKSHATFSAQIRPLVHMNLAVLNQRLARIEERIAELALKVFQSIVFDKMLLEVFGGGEGLGAPAAIKELSTLDGLFVSLQMLLQRFGAYKGARTLVTRVLLLSIVGQCVFGEVIATRKALITVGALVGANLTVGRQNVALNVSLSAEGVRTNCALEAQLALLCHFTGSLQCFNYMTLVQDLWRCIGIMLLLILFILREC